MQARALDRTCLATPQRTRALPFITTAGSGGCANAIQLIAADWQQCGSLLCRIGSCSCILAKSRASGWGRRLQPGSFSIMRCLTARHLGAVQFFPGPQEPEVLCCATVCNTLCTAMRLYCERRHCMDASLACRISPGQQQNRCHDAIDQMNTWSLCITRGAYSGVTTAS